MWRNGRDKKLPINFGCFSLWLVWMWAVSSWYIPDYIAKQLHMPERLVPCHGQPPRLRPNWCSHRWSRVSIARHADSSPMLLAAARAPYTHCPNCCVKWEPDSVGLEFIGRPCKWTFWQSWKCAKLRLLSHFGCIGGMHHSIVMIDCDLVCASNSSLTLE